MRNALLVVAGLLSIGVSAVGAELEYAAKLERLGRPQHGTLRLTETHLRWAPAKGGHELTLEYAELQRVVLEPRALDVTGYADRKWRLGADAHWRFNLNKDAGAELYALLRAKLDARFAPHVADDVVDAQWTVPAKLFSARLPAGNWGGEGTLLVGADRIVFRGVKPGHSRTWLDKEIDNVSFDAPFRLTLAVREGGVAVERELQLKRELDPKLFDALWRRLNNPRGLELLSIKQN